MSRATRRWMTAAVSPVVVSLLVACSGSSPDAREPNASVRSTTPNSTSSPSDDATPRAKAAVLAAYQGYWSAQIEAQAHPRRRLPKELGYFSIDKAQSDIQATVLLFRSQGIRLKGKPQLAPKISEISLGSETAASIIDCVDSTNWKPVYVATGKSALAPNQEPRVVMESTAEIYDGRWVIRTSEAHRDRTC